MNKNKIENPNQMILFTMGGLFPEELSTIFKPSPVQSKGATVGAAVGVAPRKEIAKAFGLTKREDKEALDAKILEGTDSAWRQVRGQLSQLGNEWTLKKVSNRTTADGNRQISLVIKEVKRKKAGPSDEDIAKTLGMTVEQVKEMRARQEAALKAAEEANQPTDVTSELSEG